MSRTYSTNLESIVRLTLDMSTQGNHFNSMSNPNYEDPVSAFKEEYEICRPVEVLGEVRFKFLIFLGWVRNC